MLKFEPLEGSSTRLGDIDLYKYKSKYIPMVLHNKYSNIYIAGS
jgi:hypothetical protein